MKISLIPVIYLMFCGAITAQEKRKLWGLQENVLKRRNKERQLENDEIRLE